MRLCLGTVQFGIDYGLSGRRKPSLDAALEMLDFAVSHGVDAVDTSALYGDAECVVGEFLARGTVSRSDVFLVSKFGTAGLEGLSASACAETVLRMANGSLKNMGASCLDACICHVPTAVYDERIMQALRALKEAGLARHVGFSSYEVEEATAAIKSGVVDFLQIPFSIFDQRMFTAGVLDQARSAGVTLHARSAFVQGLLLRRAEQVPSHLAGIVPYLKRLDELVVSAGVTRQEAALAFVRGHSQVSHLVFGVHDLGQLQDVIHSFSADVPAELLEAARQEFADIDPVLVMPNKWSALK